MTPLKNFPTLSIAVAVAVAAAPCAAAADAYVFRAKPALIGGSAGSAPPAGPVVGENGYAGKLNGRDVWVSAAERVGAWATFGPEGAFLSGGTSRDDGKANTDAQVSHARGAENLASQFCRSLAPVDGQAWHLPALNELRFLVGTLGAKEFEAGQIYWSSSELPSGSQAFSTWLTMSNLVSAKAAGTTVRTRCIRYGG